jgi:putative transposase
MARTPDPKRQALWRDRIRRQESSGLTIAQFCVQERCAGAAFYKWRQRFRLTDVPARSHALPTTPAFLPVSVRVVEHVPDALQPIEADLPNGIRLRIPTANAPLVCRVVRAVAGARTRSGGS